MIATALLALGLVMIIEGLAYVLAPSLIEQVLKILAQTTIETRRLIGATAVVLGLISLWTAHVLGLTVQI